MMRTSMFFVLYLVNAVTAFTSKQTMDRLHYIEDRLNAESKFRREDFNTLFQEVSSIQLMLQQTLEDKKEGKDIVSVQVQDKKYTDVLADKVSRLTKAFRDEKNINMRFRQEISDIQKHVQDLQMKTEHISTTIQENILNLERLFKQKMISNMETLASMSNDIKELQENQEQCLEIISVNNNLTKRLADSLSNGKLYITVKENDKQTEPLTTESTTSETIATKSKSCKDLNDHGHKLNGVYEIEIESGRTISVYCDMTTDGGGWTVFQRRQDGSVDFYRDWKDYKAGFGDLNGELWLGNEYLNILTDTTETHELRVDLEDHDGNHAFAKYSKFKVGQESENFKLDVSGYTGDAGDSLENPSRFEHTKHNGMEFTTKDRDNDNKVGDNCAIIYHGAWWYNNCFDSNLNSLYYEQFRCQKTWVCIVWNTWKGSRYSMKFTEMKLR